jgi:hypothetical protein
LSVTTLASELLNVISYTKNQFKSIENSAKSFAIHNFDPLNAILHYEKLTTNILKIKTPL